MQTRSSAATARSESWPSVSGKFLCFTFFLCSTITPALAGFEGHGIHGFTMPHDNRTAHSLFYGGLRGGLRPNVYQGPLAVANRELRERQNNVIANPAPKTAESGRERLAIRDPNQPDSVPSFTAAPGAETQLGNHYSSREIKERKPRCDLRSEGEDRQ
jgi:hypothetical protein